MRLRDLYRDRAVWLYGLLTAIFFYRPLTTQTFFFRDLYLFFYPKKVLLADALRAGTFPLWDPFTNGGQPYLATPTTGTLHPSNVLYAILPVIAAFNIIPVLHVFLCAVSAYWLARVVGLSRSAAFVAGIVYAYSGVTLSGLNLNAWVLSLPAIPLTAGLAHRALREGRSIAPAAFAAAIPLYAGMAELTGFMFAVLAVWIAAARYPTTPARRAAGALILFAGAVALSLVVLLPATSVIEQSSRGSVRRTYESFTAWSVDPRRLPELAVPRFFGRTDTLSDADYWGSRLETDGFPYVLSLYFGVPVLLLAISGAMGLLEGVDAPRRALGAVAILAVLLMLGRHLPGFRWIYDYVPFVTIFRFPVKACLLGLLPIAILAGCGVERMAIRRWIPIAIAAALLLALLFIDPIARVFDFTALAPAHRTMLTWSFIHAAAATLGLLIRRREILGVVITADLLIAGWSVNTYAPREIFDPPPLAQLAKTVAGPLRLYSQPHEIVLRAPSNDIRWLAEYRLHSLDDYTAATFGIRTVFHQDYDSLAPRRTSVLGDRVKRMPWEDKRPWLDRAGVRVIVAHGEIRLPGIREMTRAGAVRLYVNDEATAARFVGPCDGAVALRRLALNDARYSVDAPCDGHVVFAENHYDGWRATVDGRAVPHVRADFAFTAVAVPKGRHEIERRYFPPRLIAGAVGALMTALALLVLQQLARRRENA